MACLRPFALRSSLLALTLGAAAAQTPVVTFGGETMRLRSAQVTPAGGNFQVVLTMENDNQNGGLPTSFRRWWHCEIGNLPAAGTTLVVTVDNAGYTDVILPVWARSTDGVTFGDYERLPLSAVPTQPTSTSHRFTLVVPAGVAALRLAKYFPYGVVRKDAFVAGLPSHPHVRSVTTIGQSVQARPIQLVELTDATVPDAGKRRIWIHAGIHPAETTSYFTVEGLVQWLASGDPFAELLLDHTIVDIVPMANPDGVHLGNYRTNANSSNLENEWTAPYNSNQPEIVALRTAIETFMGTAAAPGSNPIVVVLNLHSSHNLSFPFHFLHTANANWSPTGNNSGVIPIVHQLETQWIAAFRQRSPFVNLGTTQSSSAGAPSRPFVESMMHDRWSAVPAWTGAAMQEPVMAITFEGTYGAGPAGGWNDEDDYRLVGAQLGRALCDHLGLQLTASATSYGVPCAALQLLGTIAPAGNGHQATLSWAGGPANGLAFLMFGFQPAAVPLPSPWQTCLLRQSLDSSVFTPLGPLGTGGAGLFLPPWPGLTVRAQVLSLDATPAVPVVDTSNGVELRNNF